ncbi:sodium/potassium-transporting ATPase subunit beta-1-like [Musca vetustissima]|uniref:sodium/potassium-transporting ATPase subunit beta-1-like n=1 Tax=Musca vetustissima TaxID=27455 RepID=UPI002AB7B086|nr:sodium/potassium-transporting ATPase subunit beta-1-like [Musca vetustissima]
MSNFEEPFRLRKRFRHEEEREFVRQQQSWHKNILDLEYGTYLGRTPKRWLYLLLFYVVFYCGLAILSALCYVAFRLTLPHHRPKWSMQQPGFSFEPQINSEMNIFYNPQNEDEVAVFVEHIEKSLRKYGDIPENYFGNCTSGEEYGYAQARPCVFLKINRIIGFQCETIEKPEELPQEAPPDLYRFLQEMSEEERHGRIWVSCQSNPPLLLVYLPQRFYNASIVNISRMVEHKFSSGPVDYSKQNYGRFYNSTDFQRIIAVQISNVISNVKYSILCSLWAKNIEHEIHVKQSGHGRISFNLRLNEG